MHGQNMKLIKSILILIIYSTIVLISCTAHYNINKPISSLQVIDYSIKKTSDTEQSDELLLMLTFSGGGMRAAAFAYGVIEALANTQVVINKKSRRLLDEVDIISSVSGGSFTAAYYGLFGNRIFEDFETKFLKHNVQADLYRRLFLPKYWPKLASGHYARSDLAADYYDELLFENKTFRDILSSQGPIVAINATDIILGHQFTFDGSQFETICSDLLSFPVSRAVAASSAVPGAFTSITIENHASSCGYKIPRWAAKTLSEKQVTTPRYQHAKQLRDYQDSKTYAYIHLMDGGITDNLGVRPMLNIMAATGDIWPMLEEIDLTDTSKIAVIVVNAQREKDISYAKVNRAIPIKDLLSLVSIAQLENRAYETMEILKNNISQWEASITANRCRKGRQALEDDIECAAKAYLIEVNFDSLQDVVEREHLKNLTTSFRLESDDVEKLIDSAKKILQDSSIFQDFIRDLK